MMDSDLRVQEMPNMPEELGRVASSPRVLRTRLYALAGGAVALLATFVGGAYTGRWAVKHQLRARLQGGLWRKEGAKRRDIDENGEWLPINTALVRIESTVIHLPNGDGWGGGIQPMEDGRIFYATKDGEFGVIETDGVVKVLPFKVEMNLDALKRHPVYQLGNFPHTWVRVTDINLTPTGAGRYELLVGHHYFEPKGQCMELRLSRALVSVTAADVSLAEPFRTVMTTTPCITFYHPGYMFAFEGHFSGGRIARLGGDQVLFSTGDHGWVGTRGYPALAQDDNSTLGKVLLVNVATNEVSIFAKGFRNPQGLTIDSRGRIWVTDQGPQGGDELNLVVKDQNYGWPISTYGTDYGSIPWSLNAEQGRHNTGVQPEFAWNPSIATSNLVEVRGNEFPLWKGDLLVASLHGQAIHRLRLEGTRVIYDEPIKFDLDRLRDIVELPNGHIALLTDLGTIVLLRNADAYDKTPYLDASRQQRRTTDMSAEERAFAVAGRYANAANTGTVVVEASEHLPPAAAHGETVFSANCAVCHAIESSMSLAGPSLKGVIGRRVGSAQFAYSAALAGRHETWTSNRVVDFVVRPDGMYPGTSMPPVPLTPDLQRDLASYLDVRHRQ